MLELRELERSRERETPVSSVWKGGNVFLFSLLVAFGSLARAKFNKKPRERASRGRDSGEKEVILLLLVVSCVLSEKQ